VRDLSEWNTLPRGGAVDPLDVPAPRTGSWRTGLKPAFDRSRCVNCRLCWLYCPDSAIQLDGTTVVGIDERFCKGCEICAELCPAAAIEMVDDVA
jgi:pyruvate ferredoxin oxidoreductase delta subunit